MIGVFDSGIGGLSVVCEIRTLIPDADVLYVADRARSPYGTRELAEVRDISLEIAGWLIDQGATTVVVACNTASAAALNQLRLDHPEVPIVGMEPAVKPAAEISQSKRVGVFATQATFQGELFDSVVDRFAVGVDVLTRACPEWVALVEDGDVSSPRARSLVEQAVLPITDQGADVLVLGCTHFAFLEGLIRDVSGVPVINPAPAVARRVAQVHRSRGTGKLRLHASGDLGEFRRLAVEVGSIDASVSGYPE